MTILSSSTERSHMTHPLTRWFVGLAVLVSLVSSALLPSNRHDPSAFEGHPVTPASMVPVVMIGPVGWDAMGRRVLSGVRRAVAAFRFTAADRDDVVAIAMERAWCAFNASAEPIRNPEAWGRTIAEHVSLDELRRQRRDRQRLTNLGNEDLGLLDAVETEPVGLPGPYVVVEQAERRELVRSRVQAWPPTERRIAQLLMDGGADTVTEAARLYRAEEQAQGGVTTMYPAKAKLLLDSRRHELEDLA